jgi:CheY-like chemotaxis protein
MDLSMPIMDGAERRPGGCGRSASPPIVALTAMPAERQPLQVLGFNGCLTKLVRAAMPRAATARILSSSAYLCMSSRECSKAGRTSLGQIRVPARYLLVPDTLELQDDALFHPHDVPVGHGAAAAPRRPGAPAPAGTPARTQPATTIRRRRQPCRAIRAKVGHRFEAFLGASAGAGGPPLPLFACRDPAGPRPRPLAGKSPAESACRAGSTEARMPVFWLIMLAAMLGLVTMLWLKEALAVMALTERLARRDRDIDRLDGLLLLLLRADEGRAGTKRAHEPEPVREERTYRWMA